MYNESAHHAELRSLHLLRRAHRPGFSGRIGIWVEFLAPDKTVCEPPETIATAPARKTAADTKNPDGDEVEDEENEEEEENDDSEDEAKEEEGSDDDLEDEYDLQNIGRGRNQSPVHPSTATPPTRTRSSLVNQNLAVSS